MSKAHMPEKLDIIIITNRFDFVVVDSKEEGAMKYYHSPTEIKRIYQSASESDQQAIKRFVLANQHSYHKIGFFLVSWRDGTNHSHTSCGLSLDIHDKVTIKIIPELLGLEADQELPELRSRTPPKLAPAKLPAAKPISRPYTILPTSGPVVDDINEDAEICKAAWSKFDRSPPIPPRKIPAKPPTKAPVSVSHKAPISGYKR